MTSADEAFALAQQRHYMQPPDSFTYCTSTVCPSFEVLFATSGADEAYTSPENCWYHLRIFDNTAIFAWTVFYLCVGVFTWLCVPRMLLWWYRRQKACAPVVSMRQQAVVAAAAAAAAGEQPRRAGLLLHRAPVPSEEQQLKEAHTMCRYLPSWIHACLSVYFGVVAIANGNGWVDAPLITYYFVALHSFGYFLADIIVDRDPIYVPHHLIPLLFTEVMLRYHGSLYHAVWLGVLCEIGNVICHATALYCRSIGHRYYLWSFKVVYGITRSLSMVAGVLIVHCDVPNEALWSVGPYIALCVLALYCSNAFAVFAVLRDPDTRATTIGVSAGASCFSITSLCSFGGGKGNGGAGSASASDEASLKSPDTGIVIAQQKPMISPYMPAPTRGGGGGTGARWKWSA